jgi:hypothetical protein
VAIGEQQRYPGTEQWQYHDCDRRPASGDCHEAEQPPAHNPDGSEDDLLDPKCIEVVTAPSPAKARPQ